MNSLNTLVSVLVCPNEIKQFSENSWNELVSEGYHTNLLARLFYLFERANLTPLVPERILWHFESAYRMSLAHGRDVRIEIEKINRALKQGGISPIFLKGAAYELAGDEVSFGRVYSDVDIFVPKAEIEAAEYILKLHGWSSSQLDPYDLEYYRRWMHEIPPLFHRERGTTLDVHHNLLPLTCRIKIDDTKLFGSHDSRQPQVLKVEDRILHSVVHLFMEGEFDKGLRDLSDLDMLLRQHCVGNPDNWELISKRAEELGVGRLWFYALKCCHSIFSTPIPIGVLDTCQKKFDLAYPLNALLLALFKTVLTKSPAISRGRKYSIAHFIMYLRGHWLRMPLTLLIPHLMRKLLRKPKENIKPVN